VNDWQSLYSASVVTQSVVVQRVNPSFFVEFMSRDAFVAWWAAENLSSNLQVIAWGGFALDKDGDEIYLWNPGASDVKDAISSANFYGAITGVEHGDVNLL
jgi:hypothetical protein